MIRKAAPADTLPTGTVPALDLSALAVSEVPKEEIKRSKKTKYSESPAINWLAASFKSGNAMQVAIPADLVPQFKTTIRACAQLLHIGHRFGSDKPNADGTVTVTFAGCEPRKTKNATPSAAE